MKYINIVLWTIVVSVLMFISFPFHVVVECRPSSSSRMMSQTTTGPGPPLPSHQQLQLPPVSKMSRNCPFLEGPSVWPSHLSANADIYRTDITVKVWDSQLVIEGTARSRSEVRKDGTFGVTFDLHRIVKGDAPLLRRRQQFRLQFLDNPPTPSNTNNNINNNNSSTSPNSSGSSSSVQLHSNIGRSRSIPTINNNNNSNRPRKDGNRNLRSVSMVVNNNRNKKSSLTSSSSTLSSSQLSGSSGSNSDNSVTKCTPPKTSIKTGRKYFVFASKLDAHLVPVFSPELVNKKNVKALESVLCEGCGQAPGVAAPKEMVLELKERLRVRCRLRVGNPVPTLTWYKDGKPVNFADGRYRLRAKRRQSVLVIRKAKESDAGLYMCEAKNVFGSATTTTRVLLPRTPVSTTLSPSNNSSRNLAGTTPTTLWPLQSIKCPKSFSSFCLNGGNCSYYETIDEYVCQCAEGYKGQRCDTKDIPASGSMYLSYFCIYGTVNPHYPCS